MLHIDLFLIWSIGFGGVEPLLVDKTLRRYTEIDSLEPLVVDMILRRYIEIGDIEPLVVDILKFLE